MASFVSAMAMMVWYIPLGAGLAIGYMLIQGSWKIIRNIGGFHIRQYIAWVANTAPGRKTNAKKKAATA